MSAESRITAVFYITEKAHSLASDIAYLYPGAKALKFSTELLPAMWHQNSGIIFIMPASIVVQAIAPLVSDRRSDPAVIVVDENSENVISLVSGSLGDANELTKEIASLLSARPVITNSSAPGSTTSIDLWARDNKLTIENRDCLSAADFRLETDGALRVYSEKELDLPESFIREDDPEEADIIITRQQRLTVSDENNDSKLYLRPREIAVGVACSSGMSASEIDEAVTSALRENNLSPLSIATVATIDVKADEPGITEFARKYGAELKSFRAEEINKVKGIERSEAVFQATGAYAVAAPSALLASRAESLAVPKTRSGNVTVAAAIMKPQAAGKLYVVGIGPGGNTHITPRARAAIKDSDVVIGYQTYLNVVPDLIKVKEIITTGMTQETERCQKAIELACSGKTVSLISGGDPGIYAMAGLVYELMSASENGSSGSSADAHTGGNGNSKVCSRLDVEVIPGISALNAAAARLGAPLMHDFVSISLSDRLTSWETIEKRLEAAAMADFVMVLYNPKSEGSAGQFAQAVEIIKKHKKGDTPVGVVKGAMRPGENVVITDLDSVASLSIDMQTTVIVGNSGTFVWNNHMITPRGYEFKLDA